MSQLRIALMGMAVAVFAASSPLSAQTMPALLVGEQVTGQTKQCFYDALGDTYTRTVSALKLCPYNIKVPLYPHQSMAPMPPPRSSLGTLPGTGARVGGALSSAFGNIGDGFLAMATRRREEEARAAQAARFDSLWNSLPDPGVAQDPLAGYTPDWRERYDVPAEAPRDELWARLSDPASPYFVRDERRRVEVLAHIEIFWPLIREMVGG